MLPPTRSGNSRHIVWPSRLEYISAFVDKNGKGAPTSSIIERYQVDDTREQATFKDTKNDA